MKYFLLLILFLNVTLTYAQHKYLIKVGTDPLKAVNLSDRDYANDSIAVVNGHLSLWDYYRTGNVVKVVTTTPSTTSSPYFNYVVDNTDGNSAVQTVKIDGWNGNFNLVVNWGDGTIDSSFKNSSSYTLTHTFAMHGFFNPIITANDYSKTREVFINNGASSIKVIAIHNISIFSSLYKFSIANLQIGNADTIAFPPTVVNISANQNNFTSFNPVLPSGLITLDVSDNNLISFTPNLPPTLNELYVKYCRLNSTEVNTILVYLDSLTFNAGAKTLNIVQGGSAPPTGAGAAAVTSLTSKGWTITHD